MGEEVRWSGRGGGATAEAVGGRERAAQATGGQILSGNWLPKNPGFNARNGHYLLIPFALLFIIQYLDAFGWLEPDDDLWLSQTGGYLREATLVLCILILIHRPLHYPSMLSRSP